MISNTLEKSNEDVLPVLSSDAIKQRSRGRFRVLSECMCFQNHGVLVIHDDISKSDHIVTLHEYLLVSDSQGSSSSSSSDCQSISQEASLSHCSAA